MAAGASRVAASLWSLPDAPTAEIVGKFFASIAHDVDLGREPDYALALRDAKRAARSRPGESSPFAWAALILIGIP